MLNAEVWLFKPISFSEEKVYTAKTIDLDEIDNNYIDGIDPDFLIENLQKAVKEQEAKGWTDIKVSVQSRYDDIEWELEGYRIETDKEFMGRQERIQKYNKALIEEKKKEYNKLKKEFGDA